MLNLVFANDSKFSRPILAFALGILVLSFSPEMAMAEPLPSELRSSFWALSTALSDYQMENDHNFPSSLAEIKPYLSEDWRKHKLIDSAVFVQDFADQSFYDISLETLNNVPVFVQSQKAHDGRYYVWFYDGRMLPVSEDEMNKARNHPSPSAAGSHLFQQG
jgi:hypothetical protein